MNEGIAFSIEQFKSKLTELPVGKQPVMIGRRSRRYDTLEKVMTRLDKIFNGMSVMEQITVHVNVILSRLTVSWHISTMMPICKNINKMRINSVDHLIKKQYISITYGQSVVQESMAVVTIACPAIPVVPHHLIPLPVIAKYLRPSCHGTFR